MYDLSYLLLISNRNPISTSDPTAVARVDSEPVRIDLSENEILSEFDVVIQGATKRRFKTQQRYHGIPILRFGPVFESKS